MPNLQVTTGASSLMPTMKFNGNLESLREISAFVKRMAHKARLSDEEIYQVELAVDEACTNIIEHAYSRQEDGIIYCTCSVENDGLKIVLIDYGRPFNPESIPEPDPSVPLNKISARGAGLYLMRRMMDSVRFEFHPESGNMLTMIKRRKGK